MDNNLRHGAWMQTYRGQQFWPADPRADEVDIADIAHALSLLCRFGGHCLRFYSVAEHSVLMARAAPAEHKLWALLHDASEAYVVDVPRPLKSSLQGYNMIERQVQIAVCKRFGLPLAMPSIVRDLDGGILQDEQAQNMAPSIEPWVVFGAPLGVRLQFWSPAEAEAQFLALFRELTTPQVSEPVGSGKADTANADIDRCPVCDVPFQADDLCLNDYELGECHAACLDDCPVVNLETGEPLPEGTPPPVPFRHGGAHPDTVAKAAVEGEPEPDTETMMSYSAHDAEFPPAAVGRVTPNAEA